MNALLFKLADRRLALHCAADFHAGNASWLSGVFSTAAAIQTATANSKANGTAPMLGAKPDESNHPSSGPRDTQDDMLDVVDLIFAPLGRGPSSFVKEDFSSLLQIEPSPWVMANGRDSGISAEFPFPGCIPPTALLQVSDKYKHPQLGSGVRFVLKLPLNLGELNVQELANKLNCKEAVEWIRSHYFGSWHVTPDGSLAFALFIPSVLRIPDLLQNLIYSVALRVRWANEFLASEEGIPHKFQGRDEASYQLQVKKQLKLSHRLLNPLLKQPREPNSLPN